MKKEEAIYLAIERTKDMYDKKKTKTAIYTIIVLAAILYFCWLRDDFVKILDYFTGILVALIMGCLIYIISIVILLPAFVISEHEKEDINRLKRELDSLESENID